MGLIKRLFTKESDIRILSLHDITPKRVGATAFFAACGILITYGGVEVQHENASAYETAIMDTAAAVAGNNGALVDMSRFHGVRTEYTDPATAAEDTITYSDWLDRDFTTKLRAAGKCLLLTANGEAWSQEMTALYAGAVKAEETGQELPVVEAAYQRAGDLCAAAPSMLAITENTPKTLVVLDDLVAG